MKNRIIDNIKFFVIIGLIIYAFLSGFSEAKEENKVHSDLIINDSSSFKVPKYNGTDKLIVNGNEPFFSDEEKGVYESFERYSNLDKLGRCKEASANVGKDLMPTGTRENISSIKPTGWRVSRYDFIEGEYLYNRCHLIAYCLTGETLNEKNLITCTRHLNADLMLPYEEKVARYIDRTKNHVLYRVTPIFEGDNLIASGVLMEGYSVEDSGKGIKFNVFLYNVQPNIYINYLTGENHLEE